MKGVSNCKQVIVSPSSSPPKTTASIPARPEPLLRRHGDEFNDAFRFMIQGRW